ncbi:uncharacterized protein C1orf50 homolog isoform X1 [Athalia rosae]|uniref:uncharacterized protein C1orf50 homolog isoform X1 n=1 Tax=Athalia rosae TaxID=37344 RepID=UPI00203371F1|nr:uncharacterized protein C1orf50 homolog isoform X1 [Athalia rosae]XP_012264023.2 uncharacterized protein C1orf50 homolog isoform X1 [Athalia rosae]
MKRSYITMELENYSAIPSSKVRLVERNVVPQGVALVNPSASAKKAPNDLVMLAMEIQKADDFVKANACNKLQIIAEQMKFLQKQAENVLQEAKQNTYLHHAACNFRKQPGHVYHIYLRESGQTYFSMLSPEEWGGNGPPHIYKGSYRLEHDHSWTSVSKLEEKDNDLQLIHKILDSNKSFAITDDHNKMNVD